MAQAPLYGGFIVWRWGDREIEDPKLLRQQLREIYCKGFSGVVVALWETRYEVIDHKVVVAISQASQWAKARGMVFWLQADPRQASRTLITHTGERTQNLIVTRTQQNGLDPENLNLAQVEHSRYNLRYEFPKSQQTHIVQEVSLYFEPSGLERVFMFRMFEGSVLRQSVKDITKSARFFANMDEGYVEVFGEVSVPRDEIWWVMAFPRFDTNLTDFAGRQSRDLMHPFVEDLFEVSAYIDGITWDNSGYCGDVGRFPVSLSIYNSFISEFGYDLRDELLSLVLDFHDEHHIHVRQHYYHLLMETVYGAQAELYRLFHGYFGEIDSNMPHAWHSRQSLSHDLVCGNLDPWEGLATQGSGMTLIGRSDTMDSGFESMISRLLITRSLGVYSKRRRVYTSLSEFDFGELEAECWTDLMAMNSLHWLVKAYGHDGKFGEPCFREVVFPSHPLWNEFEIFNAKLNFIGDLTGYAQPEADVALVYPVDSLMAADFQSAEIMIETFHDLIIRLHRAGIQIDVISPGILKEGKLSQDHLRIRHRYYQAVIYPYPDILDSNVLEMISVMKRMGFSIHLGGGKPIYTHEGKKIPHEFDISFDPEDADLSPVLQGGIRPMFQYPDNAMATKIRVGVESYYLVRPYGVKGTYSGELRDGNCVINIPESSGLQIYHRGVDNGASLVDWRQEMLYHHLEEEKPNGRS
ncbi:hypothetical protein JW948_18430 [bacterium]|nr:hypothetical protein [bacterium]